MKQELSSLELHYLIQELQELEGAKVDQVYQPMKEELLLVFHAPKIGKTMLRIVPGKWLYRTTNKPSMPENPYGYCLYLRKYLRNARVAGIQQIGSERIVDIHLSTKEKKYHLFTELFTKGNIILTDMDGIILSPLQTQEWKDRSIKKGVQYTHPRHEHNFLIINKTPFASWLKATTKESVVKALAIDLGFGGVYAEEICFNAGIEKNKKPSMISDKEAAALYLELVAIRERKAEPCIVKEMDHIKDIVPFKLATYKNLTLIPKETYSAALDDILGKDVMQKKHEKVEKEAKQKEDKIQKVIDMQSKQLKKLVEEADICQKKGEGIYEQYQKVKTFLDEVKKAQEELPGQSLKELLEQHHLVKKIDMKTKKVIIEI